jgi:hypothetical protein
MPPQEDAIALFFTTMHPTLGEDLFTAIFLVHAYTFLCLITAGALPSFFCALWHLSQLIAVHLPMGAIGVAGFGLINSSHFN